jgi:hypothetical protein
MRRAIDLGPDTRIDPIAFMVLIRAAVAFNNSRR